MSNIGGGGSEDRNDAANLMLCGRANTTLLCALVDSCESNALASLFACAHQRS